MSEYGQIVKGNGKLYIRKGIDQIGEDGNNM